jgi:hypothetical protein
MIELDARASSGIGAGAFPRPEIGDRRAMSDHDVY